MQNYTFDYYTYKSKIKQADKVGFTIIIVLIIILLGCAVFVKTSKTKTTTFYFVQVGEYLKYADASSMATEIQSKSGAGYVYYDGTYHVLTSFYLTEDDAQSVVNKLTESYPNATVFEIEKTKFSTHTYFSDTENEILTNINSANITLIEGLYSAINRYDTSADSFAKLSYNLKTLYENYYEVAEDIKNIFNTSTTYYQTKVYIEEIIECASNLESELEQDTFAYQLKYDLIKIVVLHCSFLGSI